jgi:hypothetical protein
MDTKSRIGQALTPPPKLGRPPTFETRKVVPAVLLLPGPDEVKMANGANAEMGWDATITSANFRVKGDITLAGVNGKSVKRKR